MNGSIAASEARPDENPFPRPIRFYEDRLHVLRAGGPADHVDRKPRHIGCVKSRPGSIRHGKVPRPVPVTGVVGSCGRGDAQHAYDNRKSQYVSHELRDLGKVDTSKLLDSCPHRC